MVWEEGGEKPILYPFSDDSRQEACCGRSWLWKIEVAATLNEAESFDYYLGSWSLRMSLTVI